LSVASFGAVRVFRSALLRAFDYLTNWLRFAHVNRAVSRVLDTNAVLPVGRNPIILNYAYCLRTRRLLPRFRRSYDPDNRCDGHAGEATRCVDVVSATRFLLAMVSIDDAPHQRGTITHFDVQWPREFDFEAAALESEQ
jgi:hypothetical protein